MKESTYVNRTSDNKTTKIHARMITRKYRLHLDQTNLGLFGWHLFLNKKKTQRQMGYSSDGLTLGQMSCCSAQHSEFVWCLTLLIIIIFYILQISLITALIATVRFSYLLFKITALLKFNSYTITFTHL